MINREIEKALNLPKPTVIGQVERTKEEKSKAKEKLQELIEFDKSLKKKDENQQV
jgi:hypothetical protein